MAIDYFVQYPCMVRQQVSDAKLLAMIKARHQANTLLDIMQASITDAPGLPPADWSFATAVLRDGEMEETEITVDSLLAQSKPLQDLAQHCRTCPANLRCEDFGCGGAVHFPISAQAEQWLLSRLPADIDSPAGKLLMAAIKDFDYNGHHVDALHHRSELFQVPICTSRRWGKFFAVKASINSSQILQMLFFVGHLQAAHTGMMAYFLGYLDDQFTYSNLPDNRPTPSDDATIEELKLYLNALSFADSERCSVYIDA